MEQMTEEVACVTWEDGRHSLHLNLDEANAFIAGWLKVSPGSKYIKICKAFTNRDGILRIRRGNHGEFFEKYSFSESCDIDPFIKQEEIEWNYIDYVQYGILAPDLKLGIRSINKVDPFVGEALTSYRNAVLLELEENAAQISDFDRGKMTGHINLIDAILEELNIDWSCMEKI